MPVRSTLRLLFIGFGAAHVAGLCDARLRVPWSATLALMALLGYVWTALPDGGTRRAGGRWRRGRFGPGFPLLGGVAALTVAAAVSEVRWLGTGSPLAPSFIGPSGPIEAALLSLALLLLAVMVLGATERPRPGWRWAGVAAAAAALGCAVLAHQYARSFGGSPWSLGRNFAQFALITPPLLGIAVLGAFAAGATWVARDRMRGAGAGLALLAGLAFLTVAGFADDVGFEHPRSFELRTELLMGKGDAFILAEIHPAKDAGLAAWPNGFGPGQDPDLSDESSAYAYAVAVRESPLGPEQLWPDDFWTAEISWIDSLPAFTAALFLLGLLSIALAVSNRRDLGL